MRNEQNDILKEYEAEAQAEDLNDAINDQLTEDPRNNKKPHHRHEARGNADKDFLKSNEFLTKSNNDNANANESGVSKIENVPASEGAHNFIPEPRIRRDISNRHITQDFGMSVPKSISSMSAASSAPGRGMKEFMIGKKTSKERLKEASELRKKKQAEKNQQSTDNPLLEGAHNNVNINVTDTDAEFSSQSLNTGINLADDRGLFTPAAEASFNFGNSALINSATTQQNSKKKQNKLIVTKAAAERNANRNSNHGMLLTPSEVNNNKNMKINKLLSVEVKKRVWLFQHLENLYLFILLVDKTLRLLAKRSEMIYRKALREREEQETRGKMSQNLMDLNAQGVTDTAHLFITNEMARGRKDENREEAVKKYIEIEAAEHSKSILEAVGAVDDDFRKSWIRQEKRYDTVDNMFGEGNTAFTKNTAEKNKLVIFKKKHELTAKERQSEILAKNQKTKRKPMIFKDKNKNVLEKDRKRIIARSKVYSEKIRQSVISEGSDSRRGGGNEFARASTIMKDGLGLDGTASRKSAEQMSVDELLNSLK